MHKILEQNTELKSALWSAYLEHVKIEYAGGTTKTGYISFTAFVGGTPLLKRGYMSPSGAVLLLEGITEIAKTAYKHRVIYSVEGEAQ